jgi:DNA-binding NtrC family response regulator
MAEERDVLVIDDEQVVRDGVRRILQADGLTVAEAGDAAGALEHPALGGCRLVLCDLILPDRLGTDLLKEIRRARPGVAVVMMTGYATDQYAAEAREAGATAFLPKPFEESELLEVVRGLLRNETSAAREKPS